MKTVTEILKYHAKCYPDMMPEDAVKLLFQQEFGGGHIVEDEEKSLDFIRREYANTPKTDCLLTEDIGGGMTRVYLGGLEECALEKVNRLFVAGSRFVCGDMESFKEKLTLLEKLTDEGEMPFDSGLLKAFLSKYRADGCPILSHSQKYKESYHPAYRVMPERYAVLIPLIAEIEKRNSRGLHTILAIDGQCGSGKTTIADLLKAIYNASVIRMDDFFVPPALRDEPHKKLPVHYERFEEEVLPNLRTDSDFFYTAFDCSKMDYGDKVSVENKGLVIVEGSYSLAPRFGRYYDISAYVCCSPTDRIERLSNRCQSEALMQRFINEWIPCEDRYCEEFGIDKNADFIIET